MEPSFNEPPELLELEHNGMACLYYERGQPGVWMGYGGLTCDWSKYKKPVNGTFDAVTPDNPECVKEIDGKCVAVTIGEHVRLENVVVHDSHGYGITAERPQGEGDE